MARLHRCEERAERDRRVGVDERGRDLHDVHGNLGGRLRGLFNNLP